MLNPNFPQNLDIQPSAPSGPGSSSEAFDFVHQQEAIRTFGIAGKVWKAAYALNTYIKPPPEHVFDPLFLSGHDHFPRVILELGSGSGIVAATLAPLLRSADVLLVTDLPEVCPLLEQNLQPHLDRAGGPNILVRPLAWGDSAHAQNIAEELSLLPAPHLTHILCSDLVYFPELLAPLLRSLLQLSSPPFVSGTEVELIISYKIRSLPKETPFWSAFGLWFEFAPVLVRKTLDSSWQRFGESSSSEDPPPTFVFVARRRRESHGWPVPPSDADLMQGVGAQETSSLKGDDTFESLLLMSLDVK
ncbi:putative methyltransferase-domain-containing protein [Mycena filopes]|nr:putative methyltransferase-domain-containing protein [Mycena filopes]